MTAVKRTCLALTLLAVSGLHVKSAFAQVFSGSSVPRSTIGSPGQANYFAVMGHVKNPRVFELATSSPPLVGVIDTFAGGLTPSAQGQIRIIRNGREGSQLFFSQKLTARLMPGDLLIVDGKQSGGTIFRGGRSNTQSGKPINVALVGVLPYPILMKPPVGRETIRWITSQLGQTENAALSARSIVPQKRGKIGIDTTLPDCAVIVYDPSSINVSRLPAGLPQPYRPGHPQGQTDPNPGVARTDEQPSSRLPVPGSRIPQRNHSAAPGHAAIPTTESPEPQNNLSLPRADEEAVKDFLTDPRSVPFENRQPTVSGRARVSDARASASPSEADDRKHDSASAGRSAPNTIVPSPDSSPAVDAPQNEETSVAQPPGREATRPFTSVRNRPNGDSSSDNTAEADKKRLAADSESRLPLAPIIDSKETNNEPSALIPEDVSGGRKSGTDGINARITPPQETSSTEQEAGQTDNSTIPSPLFVNTTTDANSESSNNSRSGTDDTSQQRQRKSRTRTTPGRANSASTFEQTILDSRRNWPIVVMLVTISVAVLFGLTLVVSMFREEKAEPRQIVRSERYWLDRVINNDLPVTEESVDFPHETQLFGKPEPIIRIDSAHASIKRPHFLNNDSESDGVGRFVPAGVDDPASGSPDSPSEENSDPGVNRPNRHSDGGRTPTRSTPPVPMRPAAAMSDRSSSVTPQPRSLRNFVEASSHESTSTSAESRTVDQRLSEAAARERRRSHKKPPAEAASPIPRGSSSESVSGQTAGLSLDFARTESHTTVDVETAQTLPQAADESKPSPTRTFRVDTGHASMPVRASRKSVSVKPAPAISDNSDLLDRVLSSMEKGEQ